MRIMDMRDEAWDLLENLKAHQGAGHRIDRLAWALRLDDLMRHPGEVTFVSDLLEHVVGTVIPMESDREVRAALFDAVSNGMSKNLSVDVSLDPLVALLDDDDPALICETLLLVAKSGDLKYRPLVERYRAHANDLVRKNAEYAWEWTYRDRDGR